jgi:hypothetical protein
MLPLRLALGESDIANVAEFLSNLHCPDSRFAKAEKQVRANS